jgi:hypothetical protein
VLALELTVCLLLVTVLLERGDLGLRQYGAFLRHLRLEQAKPLLHVLHVVALPDGADTRRRDLEPALRQLVGYANLPPRRLLHREFDDGRLDLGRHPVAQPRTPPTHLGERRRPARLVQLLESVEAIATDPHRPACS